MRFTLVIQAGLAVLLVGPVLLHVYGYPPDLEPVVAAVASILAVLLLALAYRVAHPEWPGWDWAMRIHLFLIPFSLVLLFLPLLGYVAALAIVTLYALPGVTLDFTWNLARSIWGAAAHRVADETRTSA